MRTDSPLVSVVLNVYNRAEGVCRTLDRIKKSTYEPIEIIVVDDCSPDETVSRSIAENHPDVKLFRLYKNHGELISRNFGMATAQGKYLLVLDDDSFPGPDCIEKMVAEFEADSQLGILAFRLFGPDCDPDAPMDEHLGERTISDPAVFTGCGMGLRQELLEKVGYWDDWYCGPVEYAYTARVIDAGYRCKRFSDIYVHHMVAMTGRSSKKRDLSGVKGFLHCYWTYFPAFEAVRETFRMLYHCCYLAFERKTLSFIWSAIEAFFDLNRMLKQRRPLSAEVLKKFHLTKNSAGINQ